MAKLLTLFTIFLFSIFLIFGWLLVLVPPILLLLLPVFIIIFQVVYKLFQFSIFMFNSLRILFSTLMSNIKESHTESIYFLFNNQLSVCACTKTFDGQSMARVVLSSPIKNIFCDFALNSEENLFTQVTNLLANSMDLTTYSYNQKQVWKSNLPKQCLNCKKRLNLNLRLPCYS